jgi:hypothetical protein
MFFKSKSDPKSPDVSPVPKAPASIESNTPSPAAQAAGAKLSDLDRKLAEVLKRLGRIEANLIDIREWRFRGEREIH